MPPLCCLQLLIDLNFRLVQPGLGVLGVTASHADYCRIKASSRRCRRFGCSSVLDVAARSAQKAHDFWPGFQDRSPPRICEPWAVSTVDNNFVHFVELWPEGVSPLLCCLQLVSNCTPIGGLLYAYNIYTIWWPVVGSSPASPACQTGSVSSCFGVHRFSFLFFLVSYCLPKSGVPLVDGCS